MQNRYVLQPRANMDIGSGEQQREITQAYRRVWTQGAWSVYNDELYFIENVLKLKSQNDVLLTQGRSKGITVVMGFQRPVGISRFAMSSATHFIAFRQDGRDVKTIVDATSTMLKEPLLSLDKYEFVWYYRPRRQFWRGKLEDLLD